MRLRYLGWSSFALTLESGESIVFDPFLSGDGEHGIPPSPVRREELYPIAAVVVSHAAADHLGEAFAIAKETGAKICGAVDVRLAAIEAGIPSHQFVLLVSGARYATDAWTLKAVTAQHISFSRLNGGFVTGQPLAFVFEAEGVRIYHGGDTSISMDLELFGRLYRPNVALLGVGGILFEGRQEIVELEPGEAALAAEMLGVDLAIPMHYRKDTDAEAFVRELARLERPIEGRVLTAGESVDLPR